MGGLLPEGYLRLSDAICAVAGMLFAGHDAKAAVKQARDEVHDVQFSMEELQEAADELWRLIDAEKVEIRIEHQTSGRILKADPSTVSEIPFIRKYRVSSLAYLRRHDLLYIQLQQAFPNTRLQSWAAWLQPFRLLVRETEIVGAHAEIRARRKRHVSRPLSSNPPGRPSKAAQVKPAIRDIVEARRWAFPASLKDLTNLVSRTLHATLSERTVGRCVDELLAETGDRRFVRPRKGQKSGAGGW